MKKYLFLLLFISCQSQPLKSSFGNFRIITIEPSTFDMPVIVLITEDISKALKFVKENKPGLDLTKTVKTPSGEDTLVEIGFGVEFFRPFYGL